MSSFSEEATEEAASALTALHGRIGKEHPSEENDSDHGEFLIPQRFTKSGRKKAVPFPLKVRSSI